MLEFIGGVIIGKLLFGKSRKEMEKELSELTPEQKKRLSFELKSISPTDSPSPTGFISK